jgi:two-component system LytT family sensor kinase
MKNMYNRLHKQIKEWIGNFVHMILDKRFYNIVLQILLWGLFLLLPYFMIPHNSPDLNRQLLLVRESQPYWVYYMFLTSVSLNLCLIIFFYIHNQYLFDRFILQADPKTGYTIYTIIVILSFGAIFGISYLIRNTLLQTFSLFERHIEIRDVIRSAMWFFLVLFAGIGVKLTELWRHAEKRARDIENEHLRTELSFLHMQINPHFLFNSLNTIYGMSLKKSDNAPKAVMKLSQLLRYMIEETGHNMVPLEQEVTYLNNFIELQKMRSGPSLNVTFDVEGDINTANIAPMLLLPFVENAFKYGLNSSEDSPINIILVVSREQITFSVFNRKFENMGRHSSGIGIPNVERRLQLLYPDKHELTIEDKKENYFAKLKISLV